MTKQLLTAVVVLVVQTACMAGSFTIHVTAPKDEGHAVLLYRYDDLLTLRTIRVSEAMLATDGKATLSGNVEGTQRMQLRIADAIADVYVRSGSVINVEWPGPDPMVPRSLNRPVRVPIVFHDMDALDINALTSDLNERLDAFLMEDLATDAAAGMQVFDIQRKSGELPDTSSRPPTLFVTPDLSTARVDTFEHKLKRFYRGIEDPWFDGYLEYGIAGLRHGPRANDRELYERYLKGRPVLYSNPEYVRFLRSIFEDHLQAFTFRHHQRDLENAMASRKLDSLTVVFARHDFLKDDARLCELVVLDQLYMHYNNPIVHREAAERMLLQASTSSTYPEHRMIATNMLWDVSTMSTGSPLPAMRLTELDGTAADPAILNEGPVCVVITATWCTYCELEMAGLEQLHEEYEGIIPIVVIALDQEPATIKTYLKRHPARDFIWLHAEAENQLREDLRIRHLPTVLLLQDGKLLRSPAPLPSGGLGEVFHRARVNAEQEGRIKVWDE